MLVRPPASRARLDIVIASRPAAPPVQLDWTKKRPPHGVSSNGGRKGERMRMGRVDGPFAMAALLLAQPMKGNLFRRHASSARRREAQGRKSRAPRPAYSRTGGARTSGCFEGRDASARPMTHS